MKRDEWKCKICGDGTKTLAVHHISYRKNTLPWDYNDGNLVTLCEKCHTEEHHVTETNGYDSIMNPNDFVKCNPDIRKMIKYIENDKGYWNVDLVSEHSNLFNMIKIAALIDVFDICNPTHIIIDMTDDYKPLLNCISKIYEKPSIECYVSINTNNQNIGNWIREV